MLTLFLLPAGAGNSVVSIRVFTTEPAFFEYIFTGATKDADGRPLLSFNHRSGRTFFIAPGKSLGPYRIASFECKTNRVFNPSINASLDELTGSVTLAGPGNTTVILEQDRRLPWPGRVAWLVRLDSGAWWSVQEMDVFFADGQPVAVEEIDEDGATVTVDQDLQFIPRMTSEEKKQLNRLWAEAKLKEQQSRDLELKRRQEAAKLKPPGSAPVTVERGTHVEIRGPSRFFYGDEYRFPSAFKIAPAMQYVNGQLIQQYIVVPTRFETRYSGVAITVP